MFNIEFEYMDRYSNGKWHKQSCVVNSVTECIKLYGLGTDCEYRITYIKRIKY